jgi:hypothetical protein
MSNLFGVLITTLASFIFDSDSLLLDTCQSDIAKLDIVITVLDNEIRSHPGRGYMAYGGIPRAPAIQPVHMIIDKMRWNLTHDNRCFQTLGVTPFSPFSTGTPSSTTY